MLNIKNNANAIKREILVQVARLQFQKTFTSDSGAHPINKIPKEIVPTGSTPFTCCIYHDRELMKMRTLAALGFSVENYDEDKEISDYCLDALSRDKPTFPMLTVLHEACNACVKQDYIVTNACQGCFARPCEVNCPKKAISVARHAHIDNTMCIHCGLCEKNCPYHAILKLVVPCEAACPVGAITKASDGHEVIDYHKCIYCGNCMRECPFSAMMDKSQIVDVIKHIMAGRKVIAMVAPAVVAQFKVPLATLDVAIKQVGFSQSIEVALGADICADHEAAEFAERMQKGERLMTTSCCSSYTRAVRRYVPSLAPAISETKTPMHYTAEIAKKQDPDCVTVFVGPCLSKKREGMDDDLVDYVLTCEELNALFIAKDVVLANIKTDKTAGAIGELGLQTQRAANLASEVQSAQSAPQDEQNKATPSGRGFAKSGGVAEAVKQRLQDQSILKAANLDGLDKKGMAVLKHYGDIYAGKATDANAPNLVEVMCCAGGCIAGPSVIQNPATAKVLLDKYSKE